VYGFNSSCSGYGAAVGFCDHDNEPSVYIKGREFFD
jgi:hypothetical protein